MIELAVFIPVYNAEKYLRQTIDSILSQTFSEFILVLVDDGSTDNSYRIMQEYSSLDDRVISVQNDRNMGASFTRNRVLELCNARYIAFMDADDLMPDYRLAKQIAYLKSNPNCDIVFGNYQLIDQNDISIGNLGAREWTTDKVKGEILFENMIPLATVMFRRSFWENNNIKFDETNRVGLEDYELWIECLQKGAQFVGLKDILQLYRVVETGLSVSNSQGEKQKERDEWFDRIRDDFLQNNGILLSDRQKNVLFTYVRKGNISKIKRIKDIFSWLCIINQFKRNEIWTNMFFRSRLSDFVKRYYHL